MTEYDKLKMVNDAGTVKERKELLKKFGDRTMQGILQAAFDERLEFDLPPGVPPVNEEDVHVRPLSKSINYLPQLLKQNPSSAIRKEKIFTRVFMLTQRKDMRELLGAVKDKKLTEMFPNIDKKLVKSVFPDRFESKTKKSEEASAE